MTIATDAGPWIVPAGHAIWLPPYQVHGGQSFGPGAGWGLYLSPVTCRALPPTPRTLARSTAVAGGDPSRGLLA